MNLTDLNSDGGIGANCLHLEIGPFHILIDSGMNPKHAGRRALPAHRQITDGSIDIIIVTHCHLDHLGSLPCIARRHPLAQILMSQPSKTLAPRMLHNSVNVMSRQRAQLELPELPLYTHGEVERMCRQIHPMPYDRPRIFDAPGGEEIEITFFPSGHIPGAAGCLLNYKHRTIFISGDVLFTPQETLPGARFPDREYDTLILETTRGATARNSEQTRNSEIKRLFDIIDHTLSHDGSILIPVFALGRMQEILHLLESRRRAGLLPRCPIYCSGLGLDIVNYFDEITRKTGLVNFRRQILKNLKVKPLPDTIKPGRNPSTPSIFLVSSGMLVEHTPSYLVASSLLEYHQNSICYVGYCDPDTPGGKMLATHPGDDFLFDTLDYSCPLNAHIERIDLSGHADRDELLAFALGCNPRALVLTHGDKEARNWFMDSLYEMGVNMQILDPEPLKKYLV